VAGYEDWAANGIGEPEQVATATAAYRQDSDALRRFIDQRCLTGPQFTSGSTDLFTAWSKWCADEGEDPGTQTAFATALQNKGLDKTKDRTGRMRWRGIGLAGTDDGGSGGSGGSIG
jgi:phage/plasmid-associated DNA primase